MEEKEKSRSSLFRVNVGLVTDKGGCIFDNYLETESISKANDKFNELTKTLKTEEGLKEYVKYHLVLTHNWSLVITLEEVMLVDEVADYVKTLNYYEIYRDDIKWEKNRWKKVKKELKKEKKKK